MRLPSPAQRAGFRVGIIAQRANGPAICPMMQMSGPLALRDSIRCALTFNQRIHTDLPREKRIKSNQHPRLILSVKELAISQRHRLISFARENHDAGCHDTLDETALILNTFFPRESNFSFVVGKFDEVQVNTQGLTDFSVYLRRSTRTTCRDQVSINQRSLHVRMIF